MFSSSASFFVGFLLLRAVLCLADNRPALTPCQTLSSSLPGIVAYPGSKAYNSSIQSYFFAEEELCPNCIVSPASTPDVAKFIKTLQVYPQSEASNFAIRGGGMLANIGSGNINGGVLLDLSNLKTVSINADGSIISASGGTVWGDVYKFLDPLSLGVVGSRISSSGLGGSITGGGLSFFSPRRGFNCDNVQNAEVVLASGEVIQVNSTSHSDLFKALKGGSNNFGIITRFDLKTFSQGSYWGGVIEYPESADSAQLQALADFKDPSRYDPDAESELSFLYLSATNSFTSANNMFYAKPIVNASGLGPFLRVQPQTIYAMQIANSSFFSEQIYGFAPHKQQGVLATLTFKSSISLLNEVHSIWKTSSLSLQHVTNLTYNLDFQGVPPGISGSNNSLGTPESTADLVLCLLSNFWAYERDTPAVTNATRLVYEQIRAAAQKANALHSYEYLNYAASWQDPIASYGVENQVFLRNISRRYDPTGLFQNRVPGGFKLWS